jgi:hypothetical protein
MACPPTAAAGGMSGPREGAPTGAEQRQRHMHMRMVTAAGEKERPTEDDWRHEEEDDM